jgi:hypothetical protein
MDYTANPDINNVGDGLDMDMVHDFGEGVGLDMRDFPVHEVDDLEDKHLGRSARPRPTGRPSPRSWRRDEIPAEGVRRSESDESSEDKC